jgi:hypothetical protein
MSVEAITATVEKTPPKWAGEPKTRLSEFAAEAYRESGEDQEGAEWLLLEKLRDNPPLMVSILDGIVHDAIRQHMRSVRRKIQNTATQNGEPESARLAEMQNAKEVQAEWYRMPMPGGKKLGEATKADLLEAAKFHRGQSKANNKQARLYERISKKLPSDSSLVSAELSEDQIDEIWNKS